METIVLDFKGYFYEEELDTLEDISAIYCVFTCKRGGAGDELYNIKLRYIGESDELKTRITNPEHQGIARVRAKLKDNEVLAFLFAEVDGRSRERVENAMIFEHQPNCCIDGKDSYSHETVTIKVTGRNKLLHKEFTVEKGAVKRKVVNA